jgi:hypothetical protein
MDTPDPVHTKRFVSFRLPVSEVEAIEAFGRDVARRTPGLKVDRTAALRILVLSALARRDELVGNLPMGDAQ